MVYGINAFGYLAYYPAILYEHFPLEWNTTITFPNLYTAFSHHSAAVGFAPYIDGLTT
jgi:hypothetical protein